MRVLVVLAVVGCSFPEKHRAGGDGGGGSDSNTMQDGTGGADGSLVGDGGPGAFGCLGLPFPTNAPSTITFQGMVSTSNMSPFFQFSVQGITNQGGLTFFSTNSDPLGNFVQSVQTNNTAIDGHLFVNAPPSSGFLPTYYYPRRPFNADQNNLTLPAYDQTSIQQLYSSVGRNFNPQQATVLLGLADCNGMPLAGAQLMMQPLPQGLYYMRNNVLDATATTTDSTGIVVALGANPVLTHFSALAANGDPLHNVSIQLMPSALFEVLMQPGPNTP